MSTAEATKPKNGAAKDELQVAAAALVSFVSTMHAANEPGWHEELAEKMTRVWKALGHSKGFIYRKGRTGPIVFSDESQHSAPAEGRPREWRVRHLPDQNGWRVEDNDGAMYGPTAFFTDEQHARTWHAYLSGAAPDEGGFPPAGWLMQREVDHNVLSGALGDLRSAVDPTSRRAAHQIVQRAAEELTGLKKLIDDLHDAMALGHVRPVGAAGTEAVLKIAASRLRQEKRKPPTIGMPITRVDWGAETQGPDFKVSPRRRTGETESVHRAEASDEDPAKVTATSDQWGSMRAVVINAEVPQGSGQQFHDSLRDLLSQVMGVGQQQVADPQPGERL